MSAEDRTRHRGVFGRGGLCFGQESGEVREVPHVVGVGYAAIAGLISFLKRSGMTVFVAYRIVLGVA